MEPRHEAVVYFKTNKRRREPEDEDVTLKLRWIRELVKSKTMIVRKETFFSFSTCGTFFFLKSSGQTNKQSLPLRVPSTPTIWPLIVGKVVGVSDTKESVNVWVPAATSVSGLKIVCEWVGVCVVYVSSVFVDLFQDDLRWLFRPHQVNYGGVQKDPTHVSLYKSHTTEDFLRSADSWVTCTVRYLVIRTKSGNSYW